MEGSNEISHRMMLVKNFNEKWVCVQSAYINRLQSMGKVI